jgi:hypothetical protein
MLGIFLCPFPDYDASQYFDVKNIRGALAVGVISPSIENVSTNVVEFS